MVSLCFPLARASSAGHTLAILIGPGQPNSRQVNVPFLDGLNIYGCMLPSVEEMQQYGLGTMLTTPTTFAVSIQLLEVFPDGAGHVLSEKDLIFLNTAQAQHAVLRECPLARPPRPTTGAWSRQSFTHHEELL